MIILGYLFQVLDKNICCGVLIRSAFARHMAYAMVNINSAYPDQTDQGLHCFIPQIILRKQNLGPKSIK